METTIRKTTKKKSALGSFMRHFKQNKWLYLLTVPGTFFPALTLALIFLLSYSAIQNFMDDIKLSVSSPLLRHPSLRIELHLEYDFGIIIEYT